MLVGRKGKSKSVALFDEGVIGHVELRLTLSCSSRIAGGGIGDGVQKVCIFDRNRGQ